MKEEYLIREKKKCNKEGCSNMCFSKGLRGGRKYYSTICKHHIKLNRKKRLQLLNN